ncbi:ferredoxin [Streptomyces natalensis]|uniref:Ferredoxin n=1 Tax=Streptomyces natalensis ATCC 27448 TaxID=1240678 RepID=A0A0D7CQQ6_9ACTN|nr:ferredoxin [Streptomyces natalensis]KIZ18579.1 ferredoxin [Streptomyces natalensis ATCC 27448]
MADRWRVEVDRSVCIGSGMCAAVAPGGTPQATAGGTPTRSDTGGGFRLDSARQSHPVAPETDADENVLAAAEGCPVEAITITVAETGERVFPPEE